MKTTIALLVTIISALIIFYIGFVIGMGGAFEDIRERGDFSEAIFLLPIPFLIFGTLYSWTNTFKTSDFLSRKTIATLLAVTIVVSTLIILTIGQL